MATCRHYKKQSLFLWDSSNISPGTLANYMDFSLYMFSDSSYNQFKGKNITISDRCPFHTVVLFPV